jgi:hypothetical protein
MDVCRVLQCAGNPISNQTPGGFRAASRVAYDVDAQVVAAMLNAGALQMTAAMKTADFDWLEYDYNSSRREEIQLVHWDRRTAEVWVSLDRAEDRNPKVHPQKRGDRLAGSAGRAAQSGLRARTFVARKYPPGVTCCVREKSLCAFPRSLHL